MAQTRLDLDILLSIGTSHRVHFIVFLYWLSALTIIPTNLAGHTYLVLLGVGYAFLIPSHSYLPGALSAWVYHRYLQDPVLLFIFLPLLGWKLYVTWLSDVSTGVFWDLDTSS